MANIPELSYAFLCKTCFIFSLTSVIGCSYQSSNVQSHTFFSTSSNLTSAISAQELSGSVSLVRAMPSINEGISSNIASATRENKTNNFKLARASNFKGDTFGFLPLPKDYEKAVILPFSRPFVTIDYANKSATVALYTAEETKPKMWYLGVSDSSVTDLVDFPRGNYRVIHREALPNWYAPDEYFKARKLPVPPPYAAERFLENVLGPMALFVADDMVLYCASSRLPEVKGARLPCPIVEELYRILPNKAVVIIRSNN